MERFNGDLTLTSTEAADLLGVHSSTVKRWCNDGELPSRKTEGGHRRIHLGDAQALARRRGIETVLSPFYPYEAHVWTVLRAVEDDGSFQRYLTLAMGWVHRAQLRRLGHLVKAVARLDSVPFHRFCDEAVRGLMLEVGRAWHEGRLRAAEEHMVTEVIVDVLLELRREHQRAQREGQDELGAPEPGRGDRPLAIVGSVEGNRHFLGALCIRLLLERLGWDVLYLGPDVPVEDFAAIQKRRRAGLVCISLSPPATAGEISRILRVLSEFYDPAVPYALDMGGVLPEEFDRSRLAAGPFRAVDVFASCTELQASLERDREPTEMLEVAS